MSWIRSFVDGKDRLARPKRMSFQGCKRARYTKTNLVDPLMKLILTLATGVLATALNDLWSPNVRYCT